MTVCVDTSFLFSLYGNDTRTASATITASRLTVPLTLSEFNDFEFGNALRLAQFRGLLSVSGITLCRSNYDSAIRTGRLRVVPIEFPEVLCEAKRLSERHTVQKGFRSFDILLVAAALHLRADLFLTFDARQRSLAAAEGLRIEI